jgi:DNA adenine methylase
MVWARLGRPKQYIEPFCGSAAMLLGAPAPASLEVIGDVNGFIANFWRCVKHQPQAVAEWADYPVSHIDQCARHAWLLDQRKRLEAALFDCDWPGDPKVAGWWLWGQCSWIGSGWCEWSSTAAGQIPHVSDAGRGIQAAGKIPHVSDAGMGPAEVVTSAGQTALRWLASLAARLERVRIIHGDWDRCLNAHYGGADTAFFFDPPYKAYEKLYGTDSASVACAVEAWCRENGAGYRIALCGHVGDYELPGWTEERWSRKRPTYNGPSTTDKEAIWLSPSCHAPSKQASIFDVIGGGE